MSAITETRPVPRPAPRPTYISEDLSVRSTNSLNAVFIHTNHNPTRVWSYVVSNDSGEILFSGAGGGFYYHHRDNEEWGYALAGLTELLEKTSVCDRLVLHINDKNLASVFEGITRHSSNLVVARYSSQSTYDHAKALSDEVEKKLGKNIVLTTDAALKHEYAGFGWVTAYEDDLGIHINGGADSETLQISWQNPLMAELLAIYKGVKYVSKKNQPLKRGIGSLTVRSDSQSAIRLINQMLEGMDRELIAGSRHHAVADSICRTVRSMDVKFVWVKGHNGDDLNEYCDRLAVSARRHREANTSTECRREATQAILKEAHLDLRDKKLEEII